MHSEKTFSGSVFTVCQPGQPGFLSSLIFVFMVVSEIPLQQFNCARCGLVASRTLSRSVECGAFPYLWLDCKRLFPKKGYDHLS